ncbi:MAG: hypothetical protein ACFCBV_07175 [Phycisphaerales bacterium]
MSSVPNSRAQSITWFTDRLALWQANAAQIGLEEAQVTSLTGLTQTASTRCKTRTSSAPRARRRR